MKREQTRMFGKKNGKKYVVVSTLIILFVSYSSQVQAKEYDADDLKEKIEQVIDWKKTASKQHTNEALFSNTFLKNAGNSVVDWYAFALGRAGYPDDYEAYRAIIEQTVQQRYEKKGQLSPSKATEWHRISLAYLAAGGDPTMVGGHNLIADGVYNRGKTADLGTQGINGLIWGLITVDALRYPIPANAYESRADIIKRILALQLKDGGFALNQKTADIDLTAMALTALAPYYNSDEIFSFNDKKTQKPLKKSVRQAIDEAILWLSMKQLKNGDFASAGVANLESTAQVAVALTTLHIDVATDQRFIKKNHTVIDGLLGYEHKDGGFIHAATYTEENPTSLPDEVNSMASEQALYALVALYRAMLNERTLYDFRSPQTTSEKTAIFKAQQAIDTLKKEPEKLPEAITAFKKVPSNERSYVANYALLEKIVKKQQKQLDLPSLVKNQEISSGAIEFPTYFKIGATSKRLITAQNIAQIEKLLQQKVSTEQQVEIAKYNKQWAEASNAKDYSEIGSKIVQRYEEIMQKEDEIKALNEAILSEIYPFTELSIADEKAVNKILRAYNKLSSYDKKQIVQYKDVEQSIVQIDILKRERLYKYVGIAVVILLSSLFIFWKIRKRKVMEREV